MNLLILAADSATKYHLHWMEAFIFAGLVFVPIGLIAGYFIWRNSKARTQRIENENREIRQEFDEIRKKFEELKEELQS